MVNDILQPERMGEAMMSEEKDDEDAQEPYSIKFTPLAKAVADRHGGVAKLEEQIRDELTLPWGPSKIEKLFFHCVAFGGSHFDDDVPQFVCKPSEPGVLLVDASAGPVDTGETVKEGQFKGMKITINPEAFE